MNLYISSVMQRRERERERDHAVTAVNMILKRHPKYNAVQ